MKRGSAEEANHARMNRFVVRGVHGTNDANDSSFTYRKMWTVNSFYPENYLGCRGISEPNTVKCLCVQLSS